MKAETTIRRNPRTGHALTCACPPCFAWHVEQWKQQQEERRAV